MKKKAHFKVIDSMEWNSENILKEYDIEYSSLEELQDLYEQARRVWSEYYVVVDYDSFQMSSSHTYSEEFLSYFKLQS